MIKQILTLEKQAVQGSLLGWLGDLIKQHEHVCTEKRILEEILKAKTVCVLIYLNQGTWKKSHLPLTRDWRWISGLA